MNTPSVAGTVTGQSSYRASFRVVAAGLLAMVALLFWRSALPQYVQFSNDGPLGAVSAQAGAMPEALKGVWYDLSWLGSNGGSAAPNVLQGLLWLLGPLQFAKWYVPITLLIVGMGAWVLFRCLRFSPLACALGAFAAALNSDFFSTACWGVGPQTVCFGFSYLALAGVVAGARRWRWVCLALAGLAVGVAVMEGFDIGAIFSLFVAVFVFYHAWIEDAASPVKRVARGVVSVTLVAGCAVFMAAHALSFLVGTNIKGVVGAEQTEEAKAGRWDWATQWSLPKRETLSLLVPGLFGFRMDTSDGGNYWGAAGRDPAWDRYFAAGQQGPPPRGFMRYAGGGIYAGVLVLLIAAWAALQSFRGDQSVFASPSRKLIWFWLGVMGVSLLLAYGRHAPFYQFFYALPHASTIRNPAKFLHVFSWALIIVFAYGVHGLSRRYLETPGAIAADALSHLKGWWAKVRGFDRKWTLGCLLAVGVSILGWLAYVGSKRGLVAYLQTVQFDEEMAAAIAGFSFRAVGWYLLFLVLSVALVTLVVSGWFAGRRARWGGVLLGAVLVADLARANLPWIIYWNYREKYAANPVIDFLRVKSHEQRVALFPMDRFLDVERLPKEAAPLVRAYYQLSGLYESEWKQHLFLYYNIQCLDIIQEPRVASDKAAFEAALAYTPVRRWELTNTRHLLGPVALAEFFNRQVDPTRQPMRVTERFDVALRPGIANPTRYEHFTAVANTNGAFAVYDFTPGLPRAKLYGQWQVATNDPALLQTWVKDLRPRLPREWGDSLAAQSPGDLATLKQLADPGFNPAETVLLAEPLATPPGTNQNPGEVRFESYAPKRIVLRARAEFPAVLLLNDRYDPAWQVTVNGQPAPLLRANFIMRGVFLPPGEHEVEFKFQPPVQALYVSLCAIGAGVLLLGVLIVGRRREAAGNAA